MSWLWWIAMIPVAWFLWWIGFVSTKGMRIELNKERTIMWEKVAAAQKIRRAAEKNNQEEQTAASTSEQTLNQENR